MKLFLTALLILSFSYTASAQATANFTASATIVEPINISTVSNLNFANISAKEGGEITVTPQGERKAVGSVEPANGSIVTAAAFEVTGQQDFAFSVTLPQGSYYLVNGSENMMIKNFISSTGSAGNLGDGKTIVKVGATLQINPRQTPGRYITTTPMAVTVNYN